MTHLFGLLFFPSFSHSLILSSTPLNTTCIQSITAGKCAIQLTLTVLSAYSHDLQIDGDSAPTPCIQKAGEVDTTIW